MKTEKQPLSLKEFALLGEGQIAYLRQIRTDELAQKFPDMPPMAPGISLWGLFGAAGEPIILSDARAKALEGANDHELQTVTLH
ncbi:BQ00720 family protein [Bartonella sp. LJL80]